MQGEKPKPNIIFYYCLFYKKTIEDEKVLTYCLPKRKCKAIRLFFSKHRMDEFVKNAELLDGVSRFNFTPEHKRLNVDWRRKNKKHKR